MDCTRFEELLFEELEGLVEEGARTELRAHAAGCPRCRELRALIAAEAGSVGRDFTESVLARTSRDDAHRRAWRRLERDLPMLTTVMPDEGFVADVMAATARADRRRFGDRLRALWHALIRRPRFALEGAYVGALLVLLLFGLPGSPLADVPGTVLTELREGSAAVRTGVAGGTETATELGRTTWRRTGELLTRPVAGGKAVEPETIRAWRSTAGRLFQSVWETTLAPAIEWVRSAWLRLRGPESPSPAEITRGVDDGRDLQSA